MSPSAAALCRIAHTPWLVSAAAGAACSAPSARNGAPSKASSVAAAVRFARETRRLPSFTRLPFTQHAASPLLPAPVGLQRLLRALQGRFVVVNHPPAAALPRAAVALVRGLVTAAFDGWGAPAWPEHAASWPADGRAAHEQALARAWVRGGGRADALAAPLAAALARGGAPWVALALYEPVAPRVTIEEGSATAAGGPLPTAGVPRRGLRFTAWLPYRLAVVVGGGPPPPSWELIDAIAAGATGRPWPAGGQPWFQGPVLAPDSWVVACMAPPTRARWARLTGRAGGSAPDHQWHPDAWARFLEPGRRLGCVSPAEVARSRPGWLAGASARGAAPGPDAEAPWSRPPLPLPSTLTPRIERGVGVPPGYCLVHCVGTLEVVVIGATGATGAAGRGRTAA